MEDGFLRADGRGDFGFRIEIDAELADDINRSVIQEQVEMGVAVRMAVLQIYAPPAPGAPNGMPPR